MSVVYLVFSMLVQGQNFEDDAELDFPSEPAESLLEQLATPQPLEVNPSLHFEIVMLGLITIFLLNMHLGKRKNERLATGWLYLLKPILTENFSHTGVAEAEGEGEML